jgi:glutamate synthase (NADPH/NADH)
MLAEEVRSIMAKLGFRTFQELIGRTDKLRMSKDQANMKAGMLDYAPILMNALDMRPGVSVAGGTVKQEFHLENRVVSLKLFFIIMGHLIIIMGHLMVQGSCAP